MSLCRPARCGCSFASSTLDITQTSTGVVSIEAPESAASAWPVYTFLNVAELVATITSPQEGMEAWLRSTNQKVRYDGTGWLLTRQAITAYTPVYTDVTLGTGALNAGAYWVSESTLHVRTRMQLGTGGSFGAYPAASLPPVDIVASADLRTIGVATYYDFSVSRIHVGSCEVSGVAIVLYSPGNLTTYPVHSTQPFTWGPSDELWLTVDCHHSEYLA